MPRIIAVWIAVLAVMAVEAVHFPQPLFAQLLSEPEPMRLPVDPFPLTVRAAGGDVSFEIEVADRDEERSRGLMFRRDLPVNRGMLFIFEDTRRVAFWMQNTPLPLDLVFIGENGTILAIRQGVPLSTDVISPPPPVRFVLELHAGTAQKTGIADGDRVNHPLIDAIAKRD